MIDDRRPLQAWSGELAAGRQLACWSATRRAVTGDAANRRRQSSTCRRWSETQCTRWFSGGDSSSRDVRNRRLNHLVGGRSCGHPLKSERGVCVLAHSLVGRRTAGAPALALINYSAGSKRNRRRSTGGHFDDGRRHAGLKAQARSAAAAAAAAFLAGHNPLSPTCWLRPLCRPIISWRLQLNIQRSNGARLQREHAACFEQTAAAGEMKTCKVSLHTTATAADDRRTDFFWICGAAPPGVELVVLHAPGYLGGVMSQSLTNVGYCSLVAWCRRVSSECC